MEKITDTGLLAHHNFKLKEDEYVIEDVVMCMKCHTPRQMYFGDGLNRMLFPVECDCQRIEREKREKAEKEREYRNKVELMRNSGIPNPTYRSYRLEKDDNKTPELTRVIENYIDNFDRLRENGQGLLLYGDVGTGKTYYAMCIANALVERLKNVYCTSLPAVVKMMHDFDNADMHLKRLLTRDLIVIDDLGVERDTGFTMEQIYGFIDGCNTRKIPMIITTNLAPSILVKASQDTSNLTYARIYSRILEKCYPVKVNEVKRRAENARQNKMEMAKLLGVEK